MAAHPDLAQGDAEQMAEYILSLAGPAPYAESRPAKASVQLDKHKAGIPGRYYLQASYTDKGAGDGLPRLTTTDVVVLRSPRIRADKFIKGNKVMAYHVEAKDNPMSDEAADVLVATGGGWAGYGDIDLSGIKNIVVEVALVPTVTSGGTVTVLAGHPVTGQVVAEATIKQGVSTYGLNELALPVKDIPLGAQPLFFRFKADSDEAEAVLGAVMHIEFLRGEVSK
jgi:cytochrome c